MTRQNILIFTAVQLETRAIQKALAGRGYSVLTIGIRAVHLPPPHQCSHAKAIILCGVAGGLDPSLAVGDIVMDDPRQMLGTTMPYRRGSIYTAEEIIENPIQKAELFRTTGALAVDMEQSAVRKFASQLDIPLISIRAVSDTADQTLDPAEIHLVDDLGRPRPIKIATTLLRRPGLIAYLQSLNTHTKIALDHLAMAVRTVVDQISSNERT